MSTLLRPLTEVLQSFSSSSKTAATDLALWSGVIATLTKSLEADDGGMFIDLLPPAYRKPSLQSSGMKISCLRFFRTCFPKYRSPCGCPPRPLSRPLRRRRRQRPRENTWCRVSSPSSRSSPTRPLTFSSVLTSTSSCTHAPKTLACVSWRWHA